jgi:hypothetical protein
MTVERSIRGLLTNTPLDPDQVPELRQRIADHILFWRQFADALEKAAKKPGGRDVKPTQANIVLDLKRASAHVRRQTDRVDAYLMLIELDFAKGRAPNLTAIHGLLEAALLLSIRTHQVTVVDNEPAIESTLKKVQALETSQSGRSQRSNRNRRSWQAQADEIWRTDPGLSKLDVAKKIAGDDPTVNVNTIRRRINQSQK